MALNAANPGLAATAGQGRILDLNPLKYLEKIQEFDGRKEDLSTFCMNVDDIIPTLTQYNEQAQRMFINIVKSKLTGKARRTMEIHPHLNNWTDIKDMLETNFGGFQTADQLYEDLRAAQYRGNTIDFYNYIQHKLALLNQKSKQENRIGDVERNIETALKNFITRLPVYIRTVLCALKPTTMGEAIHELSQSGFLNEEKNPRSDQKNYQKSNQWQQRQQYQQQQGQQKQQYQQQQQQGQQRQQYQQWQARPSQQQWQQRPTQQQQQRPEPMDLGTSQTKEYNYQHECGSRIEACLNSRPLSPASDDPDDLSPLTPGHFLIGTCTRAPAEPDLSGEEVTLGNRWKRLKIVSQHFCQRWKTEYRKELHRRYKWKYPQENVQVNDLVVIKDERVTQNDWKMGRIVRTHPGSDQNVRVVEIRTSHGLVSRPITKIVRLPTK